MTVAELIAALQAMPQDAPVVVRWTGSLHDGESEVAGVLSRPSSGDVEIAY